MITREEFDRDMGVGSTAECIIASIAYIETLEQHIKSLEAQLANTEQLTCEWVKDSNGEEYELLPVFYTKCGSSFVFSECGIEENNFIFCPYCGGKITSKDTQ